ncbi:MAG: hypothetical protein Q9M40_00760 [Sulfurimonas sp.]|nr:hypothetical protein [Sulfurimonas sp.]
MKTILLFVGVFLVLFFISYVLLKHFLLSLDLGEAYAVSETLVAFNFVWLEISVAFFILMSATYFILKRINSKVYEELDTISEYIYEISENKNYEKTLKSQHYLEFLRISVGLKNITKRLAQKDKRSR